MVPALASHGIVDLMTKPSGWYEDPQDSSQLRYWDGVAWSSNISPKISPKVEQSTIGMPHSVTPASARTQGPQDAPNAPGGFAPPQQNQGQQNQGQQGMGPQDSGQPSGQWPPYGQAPGQYGQHGWTSNLATTPDGVALSGWWRRVLALLIDNIVVSILALPLTFAPLQLVLAFFRDFFSKAWTAAQAGAASPTADMAKIEEPLLQISLIVLAVSLVYEVLFLTRTGATPGKMAVGISVRLRERPGPPPLVAVLKRTAVKESASILGRLPVVGVLASLFGIVDVLWPLWDPKKQAIHDKVGETNVVMGKQAKRQS